MLPRFKLTKKQKELLKKLDSVISELDDAGVELAVDTDNRELLAFAFTKDQSSRFETDCDFLHADRATLRVPENATLRR